MHLPKPHRKLLRKLTKKPLLKSKLQNDQLEIVHYLGDNGLIEYESVPDPEHPPFSTDTIIRIKQKGRVEYDYCLEERRRWLIPVIISVAALIISILALVSSSQSISVYIDNQKSSNFNTATTNALIDTIPPK